MSMTSMACGLWLRQSKIVIEHLTLSTNCGLESLEDLKTIYHIQSWMGTQNKSLINFWKPLLGYLSIYCLQVSIVAHCHHVWGCPSIWDSDPNKGNASASRIWICSTLEVQRRWLQALLCAPNGRMGEVGAHVAMRGNEQRAALSFSQLCWG